MVNSLKQLFERDLSLLANEIESYNKESDLWLLAEGINNSGGNLCLHLTGNLQFFIGATLGKSGYIRDRKAEFESKDIPVAILLKVIKTTKLVISDSLDSLTAEQLASNYPIEVFGKPMSTTFFLIHLSTHLSYHLGQINYHRRLLSN